MKASYPFAVLAVVCSWAVLRADVPPELKPYAESYDLAMKEYDEKVTLLVKVDRDTYLTVLTAARKREEGARRGDAVAAIDAEIKAVQSGLRSDQVPAHLPDGVARYRTQYITAPERATGAVESVRRFTRQNYLSQLEGMARIARIAKNAELAAAVASEEKRVRAAEDNGKAEASDTSVDQAARRKACWQNVHNIGTACLSYSTKNGGAYPNSIADLVKSGELNKVPVSPFAEDGKASSYELTMPGFPGDSPAVSLRTIVLRCTFADADGKVSAGFADGHVESVPEDALAKAYNAARSNQRKWSDPTGKYSTEATFIEFVAGGVKLKKTDGKVVTVPYVRLSRADLDYLRTLNVYVPK